MRKRKFPLPQLLAAAAAVGLLCWFALALQDVRTGQDREGKELLADAITKAAVACYAAEGVYPPTLEYLQTHYGLQIDEDRYLVFYDVFAENRMPDITVLERDR